MADRASSRKSRRRRCIEVCAWQRPLWCLHPRERHLCCPIALTSAVAVPDAAVDFPSRKTSWRTTAAARFLWRGARRLMKAASWLMEAVNTEQVEMRLEDALKFVSQNFPATHHVIRATILKLRLTMGYAELWQLMMKSLFKQ